MPTAMIETSAVWRPIFSKFESVRKNGDETENQDDELDVDHPLAGEDSLPCDIENVVGFSRDPRRFCS